MRMLRCGSCGRTVYRHDAFELRAELRALKDESRYRTRKIKDVCPRCADRLVPRPPSPVEQASLL